MSEVDEKQEIKLLWPYEFSTLGKMKVITGIVSALDQYLHTPLPSSAKPVIAHGDVKSQNCKNEAKLCDIGLHGAP